MKRILQLVALATTVIVQNAAAQVTSVCTLNGNTAQCTSTDNGALAAERQREAYETGQALGQSIGMAIFRAHFPGWRRKYCSKHPSQPFVYANASGDSISGTCPNAEGLANEVAAGWIAKHHGYTPTPANGRTIIGYISEHHLSFFESKSYDAGYRFLVVNGPQATESAASPAKAVPGEIFTWFDESAPSPGAPLFDAVVTSRAYDGALAMLREARKGNTAVQAGTSVLDTDYHPSTMSLDSWRERSGGPVPSLFYWQGEVISGTTPVMRFQMTKRAYEQMLALLAGSELRMRPLQD
jgi:hypothetical protein